MRKHWTKTNTSTRPIVDWWEKVKDESLPSSLISRLPTLFAQRWSSPVQLELETVLESRCSIWLSKNKKSSSKVCEVDLLSDEKSELARAILWFCIYGREHEKYKWKDNKRKWTCKSKLICIEVKVLIRKNFFPSFRRSVIRYKRLNQHLSLLNYPLWFESASTPLTLPLLTPVCTRMNDAGIFSSTIGAGDTLTLIVCTRNQFRTK